MGDGFGIGLCCGLIAAWLAVSGLYAMIFRAVERDMLRRDAYQRERDQLICRLFEKLEEQERERRRLDAWTTPMQN